MTLSYICEDGSVTQSCAGCEKSFPCKKPKGAGRPKSFCSEPCRKAKRASIRPYRSRHCVPVGTELKSDCRGCGANFGQIKKQGFGRHLTYCSQECRDTGNAKNRNLSYVSRKIDHTCIECSKVFSAYPRSAGNAYCSISCANEKRRVYADVGERTRAYFHRRRARIRGTKADRFTDLSIFERDGWICGICNDTVDPTLRFPHHYSASLDHVIPLSKGGSHTAENCQLAHWVCNSRKTCSLPVQ